MAMAVLFLFPMVLSFHLGESSMTENVKTWCVAKPSSSTDSLVANLEYACDQVDHEDCTQLFNASFLCFHPNTAIHHTSFAMNAYYQAVGRHQWNCDFRDSGLIALTDPSYGDCIYTGGDAVVDLSTSGNWCVAKPRTGDDMLQSNIDFACNYVDCSLIRFGGACHCPDSLINHASVVMNLYYQATGRDNPSCDFNNTGLTVMKDPSYGDCKYKFQQ